MDLLDFFSREAGQRRRQSLEDGITYFVPPELRGLFGLAADVQPIRGMERAGQGAERVVNTSGWDRVQAIGDTLSEMAGVAAPVAAAKAIGMPAVRAVQEGLLGLSATPEAAAVRDFAVDEFGGMKLYRGDTGSSERITGGIGEGLLFGTPHEDVARLYGDNISSFELPDGAKVLTEGSKEFAAVTGRRPGPLLRNLRKGENLTAAANEAIERARAAGYDAVEFNSMRDMGVAVLNPSIVRTTPTDPAIQRAEEVMALPPLRNAQKTQIAGTFPTYQKALGVLDAVAPEGRALDFGAGLGMSRDLGFDTFEPFPRAGFDPTYRSAADIPDASYDRLTNLNVLNVVPREVRDGIVEDIGRVLRPGGAGVITTRGRDVLNAKGMAGPEPMSVITSADTYQKGFTQSELQDYLRYILGSQYEVSPLRLGPAGALIKRGN